MRWHARLQRLKELRCRLYGGHDWAEVTDFEPIKYCLRCTYWRFL